MLRKGELENAEGTDMNLYLHLKWLFRMLSNWFVVVLVVVFYHKQSRALFCLQDKVVAQSILEKFGFHNEYDDLYEKVFIIF